MLKYLGIVIHHSQLENMLMNKITFSQAQKSRGVILTPLKLQAQTVLINESGLYSLILRPDGFVNATQLCKAGKKLFADWKRMESTQELIQALKSSMGIHIDLLIDTKMTGKNEERGSWIHPDLAVQLAQIKA